MRILLTGSTGQVGTEFQRRSKGLEVLAPSRGELDLSLPESMQPWLHANRPDLILSVGAFTAVDRAESEADLAFRTNRDAVDVLAKFANDQSIPLIHLSTDYVFDGQKSAPYGECDPVCPTGIYGLSKLGGEVAARQAEQHVILRVSWVFAAHGTNFVRTMLRLGADRDTLRVVDDQRGGPTWAGHIAAALRTLVDRVHAGERLPSGTWHYAGEPHVSWCEFAREILAEAARRELISRTPNVEAIATHEYPTPAKRPASSRMDSSLAAKELNLAIPDWREGLSECLKELAAGR